MTFSRQLINWAFISKNTKLYFSSYSYEFSHFMIGSEFKWYIDIDMISQISYDTACENEFYKIKSI